MRIFLTVLSLVVAGPALAGGMGDPSEHTKEMNAICEIQRHGQGPLSPNLCLPEYPPGAVESHNRR